MAPACRIEASAAARPPVLRPAGLRRGAYRVAAEPRPRDRRPPRPRRDRRRDRVRAAGPPDRVRPGGLVGGRRVPCRVEPRRLPAVRRLTGRDAVAVVPPGSGLGLGSPMTLADAQAGGRLPDPPAGRPRDRAAGRGLDRRRRPGDARLARRPGPARPPKESRLGLDRLRVPRHDQPGLLREAPGRRLDDRAGHRPGPAGLLDLRRAPRVRLRRSVQRADLSTPPARRRHARLDRRRRHVPDRVGARARGGDPDRGGPSRPAP